MSFSTFNTFSTLNTLSYIKNIVNVFNPYDGALGVYDYNSYNASTGIWSNKLSNPLNVSFSNAATKTQVLGSTSSPINGSTATFGSVSGTTTSSASFIQTEIPSTTKWAIFIVSRTPSGQNSLFSNLGNNTGNDVIIGEYNNTANGILYYNSAYITPNALNIPVNIWNVTSTFVDISNKIQFHANGKSFVDNTSSVNPSSNVGLPIGLGLNTTIYPSSFEVGEIIIFNTGITSTNVTSIETYLLSKYGIAKAV
jgi:hypothetical protein